MERPRKRLFGTSGAALMAFIAGLAMMAGARTSQHGDYFIGKDKQGRRKRRKVTVQHKRVRHYICASSAPTKAERRALVRQIYFEGEERRKKAAEAAGPDIRPDHYLHSHARKMRALKRVLKAG